MTTVGSRQAPGGRAAATKSKRAAGAVAAVECAAALAPSEEACPQINAADLAFAVGEDAQFMISRPTYATLDEEIAAIERLRITEALERHDRNHTHAARALGLSRVGLLKKMDRMGLR